MKFFFARAGESEGDRLDAIDNRSPGYGLTPHGQAQAQALADSLAAAPIHHLFTSPLRRAAETAAPVAAACGLQAIETDALRELDCGVLEGQAGPEAWEKHEQMVAEWVRLGRWEQHVDGGESLFDLRARFIPFVDELMREHKQDDVNIALIGHQWLLRLMLPLLLMNVDYMFAMANPLAHGALVVAEMRPQYGLACVQWGTLTL